jgi:hypothetical protein
MACFLDVVRLKRKNVGLDPIELTTLVRLLHARKKFTNEDRDVEFCDRDDRINFLRRGRRTY